MPLSLPFIVPTAQTEWFDPLTLQPCNVPRQFPQFRCFANADGTRGSQHPGEFPGDSLSLFRSPAFISCLFNCSSIRRLECWIREYFFFLFFECKTACKTSEPLSPERQPPLIDGTLNWHKQTGALRRKCVFTWKNDWCSQSPLNALPICCLLFIGSASLIVHSMRRRLRSNF